MSASMTTTNSPILTGWRNLSRRERTLVAVMAGLAFVLSIIYLVLLPGLDAANSADSRRKIAATELAEVQRLANTITATRANIESTTMEAALQSATDLATEMNITQTSATLNGDSIAMTLTAPNSAALLDWAARATSQGTVGLSTLDIQRTTNGISANVTFARNIQVTSQ